jgi:hypothetical protein
MYCDYAVYAVIHAMHVKRTLLFTVISDFIKMDILLCMFTIQCEHTPADLNKVFHYAPKKGRGGTRKH